MTVLSEVLNNITNNLNCNGELCDAVNLLKTHLLDFRTGTTVNGSFNTTVVTPVEEEVVDPGDAAWILTSAFIIFTMQSGFGLLEAGSVSTKNEANIMIKNCMDVVFGGLSYWIFGFGLSYGSSGDPVLDDSSLGVFAGTGNFMTDSDDYRKYGPLFSSYFFQLSFATTATTIVSGAMAERTNLKGYIIFSFTNIVSYVLPAHWLWDSRGFFYNIGVVDVAGCGPVHLVGGASALVATLMLKPRLGVFDEGKGPPLMASPTNVVLGTFMLWWGWMGFNCGSTAGMSGGTELMWHLRIDDPVSCIPVHGFCAVWGLLAVGLFGEHERNEGFSMYPGIFRGGPIKYLFYQFLAAVCIIAWSVCTTFVQLFCIDKAVGLRMSFEEEVVGADYAEHGIEQKLEMLQTQAYGSHNTLMMMQSTIDINEARHHLDDHEKELGHEKNQEEFCGLCRINFLSKFKLSNKSNKAAKKVEPENVEMHEAYDGPAAINVQDVSSVTS